MAPITADKRENMTSLSTNPTTQTSDRNNGELYLYKGSYHMVLVDNNNGGKKYIFDNSGKKMYLEDIAVFQMQDETMAKRTAVQKNTLNFFADQENDFASWRDEYARKIAYWSGKAEQNLSIYEASKKVVALKEHDLNPLYEKYNTFDISKFSDGKDKKLGFSLFADRKSAKHDGNVAFSLRTFELSVVEGYKRLMNHSEFCRDVVEKLGLDCLKDMA